MKPKKILGLFLAFVFIFNLSAAFTAYADEAGRYTVTSPNGEIIFDLVADGENAEYSVTDKNGYVWIENSPLEFIMDRVDYFEEDPVIGYETSKKTDSYSHLGNFSHAEDEYTFAEFTFDKNGYSYYLHAAVFDDGVAFRYVFPDCGAERYKLTDHTDYQLNEDVLECWYGVNNTSCEGEITAHELKTNSKEDIFLPLTAVLDGGKYIAIMEADVSSSLGGMTLRNMGGGLFRTNFISLDPRTGEVITPWKVISFADSLDELVNNDNVYTLCAAPDEETYADTEWIVPGRAAWSWGVDQGSPSPGQMKDYTEYAAKLGFEYNIIDDGWPRWDDYKSELKTLGEYGDSVNVKQILWCAVTEGTEGKNKVDTAEKADGFIEMMKDCSLDGAKVDFWWRETDPRTGGMQNYFLGKAAEEHMVIDMHGCCKNSGTDRTYPNELTREGVRGLEHIGASCRTRDNEKYSELLTAQLFTRYLSGHAEWTPTVDSAMEMGSLVCIDSPLMSIASDPKDIYESEAREFIKSIPTVWDKTVVLSSSVIGKTAVFAKEKSGVWFVGGVYSADSSDVCVDLSEFLPEGLTFFADIWDDRNGETVDTRKTVTFSDTLVLSAKTKGTGFAIRLSPIELSSYGGEINAPITVTCADKTDEVLYTLDGSDPLTSPTAEVYIKPIKLNKTCTLTLSVKGKATLRYSFNQLSGDVEENEAPTPFQIWKKLSLPFRLGFGIRKS